MGVAHKILLLVLFFFFKEVDLHLHSHALGNALQHINGRTMLAAFQTGDIGSLYTGYVSHFLLGQPKLPAGLFKNPSDSYAHLLLRYSIHLRRKSVCLREATERIAPSSMRTSSQAPTSSSHDTRSTFTLTGTATHTEGSRAESPCLTGRASSSAPSWMNIAFCCWAGSPNPLPSPSLPQGMSRYISHTISTESPTTVTQGVSWAE